MSKQAPAAGLGLVLKVEKALPPKRKSKESPSRPVAPRIARLLALAYWAEARIEDGTYESYADVARAIGVTRARMTQIAQLRHLSSRLQEALLTGDRTLSERAVRPVLQLPEWSRQEALSGELALP